MEHSFVIQDAEKYGVECAVLLKNMRFWLDKNLANGKHVKDGRVWTYNSVKAFSDLFPYLTEKQIRTRLEKLEAAGVLLTDNFNSKNYDKTKWYSVNEEKYNSNETQEKSHCPNGQIDVTKWANGSAQTGKPIPDNKPYSKPDIYSENEFLEDWGKCRKSYRNLPTNIKGLKIHEQVLFNNLKKDWSKEEFRDAMRGLFMQEVIKFSAMITQPTHFLEQMEKYYNAFISKDFKQYGSKQVQH